MTTSVFNIMNKEFAAVDAYEGLCVAGRLMDENQVDILTVLDRGKLVGSLTAREMRKAHPNRIIADAMNKNIVTGEAIMSLWEAKEIVEEYHLKELLLTEDEKPVGYVTEARLYGELGKHFDLLTGLYKRDYIIHCAMNLLNKGNEISVVFIDIDNFSKINKEYGHIFGDEILKGIGMILSKYITDTTKACRFGGDEFVVLTPYISEESKNIAMRIQKDIMSHYNSGGVSITASIGMAAGRRNYDIHSNLIKSISKLINLASLASTKAKTKEDKLVVVNEHSVLEI